MPSPVGTGFIYVPPEVPFVHTIEVWTAIFVVVMLVVAVVALTIALAVITD